VQKPQKFFILIVLTFLFLSCGKGLKLDEQAATLLTLLQNKNYDGCVMMTHMFHSKMATFQGEPQFKQQELAIKVSSDIKDQFFNQDSYTSIAYLFRFPCQWQTFEAKKATVEGSDGMSYNVYRVFALVKYNSMDQSPEASPFLVKPESINYNNYKVKEIIFHCDLDPDTGWYMGWGTDKHVPW
jgi:hypothetical protein